MSYYKYLYSNKEKPKPKAELDKTYIYLIIGLVVLFLLLGLVYYLRIFTESDALKNEKNRRNRTRKQILYVIRFLKIKIKFSYNNMSLYDRYNSETNINYMYNLVNDILKQNINETITDNEEFKNIFKKILYKIFNETNTEEIEELNKILLERHVELFTGMLNVNKPPSQLQQINKMIILIPDIMI